MALVMVLVAVVALSLATLLPLRNEQQAMQREREAELLFAGREIRTAIARYVIETPGAVKQYPRTLDELVLDPRFAAPRRHLRRLYRDPFTGAADWVLIREQGAIVGVASRSTRVPLKRSGFLPSEAAFADATQVSEWRFVFAVTPAPPVASAPTAGTGPATPSAPAPSAPNEVPAAPPSPDADRSATCLRQYSQALNQCARIDADQREACRLQARTQMRACQQGG